MDANEMTFGVEIETTVPVGALRVGGHGHGCAIPNLPGWKADRDPSIRCDSGREACEFVSPVFKGTEGMQQLLRDLETIKAYGAKVNSSCGLHVHVGIDKRDTVLVDRIRTLVAYFEKAIFASTGTKSRENGRWCAGLQRHGNAENAKAANDYSRYQLANFKTQEKPTVEFRAFGATLNAKKLAAAVMTCVGIVERASRACRKGEWIPKTVAATSPLHRAGEGQTAVTRLFYGLGWTKGRTNHVHGNLIGDGVPSLKAIKKEMMRLAKKYDGPTTDETGEE